MEKSTKVLGAEHPLTLTSIGNLASTYGNQGRWEEAEKLEVQVMETMEKVLGAEHPSTLTSIGNLFCEPRVEVKPCFTCCYQSRYPPYVPGRPNVEKLINYDKDISRLMTNRLPEGSTGDAYVDVNVVLGEIMEEAGTFSSGLGIFYELQECNPLSVLGSFVCEEGLTAVWSGKRAPDVKLLKPGTFDSVTLISRTPNTGRFYVLVFAGDPASTAESFCYDSVGRSSQLRSLIKNGKDLAVCAVI